MYPQHVSYGGIRSYMYIRTGRRLLVTRTNVLPPPPHPECLCRFGPAFRLGTLSLAAAAECVVGHGAASARLLRRGRRLVTPCPLHNHEEDAAVKSRAQEVVVAVFAVSLKDVARRREIPTARHAAGCIITYYTLQTPVYPL